MMSGDQRVFTAAAYVRIEAAGKHVGEVEGRRALKHDLPVCDGKGLPGGTNLEEHVIGPIVPVHDGAGHARCQVHHGFNTGCQPLARLAHGRRHAVPQKIHHGRPALLIDALQTLHLG